MIEKSTKDRIKQFNLDREWDQFHSPSNLSKAIVIESAELLENFQWNDDFDIENVKDELADVFIYAILLAENLGLDIDSIISEKIDKNETKYSVKNSKGNSIKYTEFNR